VTTVGERALAQLISDVQSRIMRRLEAVLQREGCYPDEWWVLNALSDSVGKPMHEIAEFAMLPNPSLTKLVDRMVAESLVYRRRDTHDRRRTLLFPTARGLERFARVKMAVDSEEIEFAELVGRELVDDLRSTLDRIAHTLR
jgi:MarR family transcriptional regulator, organic hydroperoxide resistance regulator